MEEIPSIPEFYRGRKVLITGGSGFMGRVLIEKLLRSCPELHTVYLLLRPKKNTQPSMRIQQLIDVPLFNKIKRECPRRLSKLVAVCGDVKELGLGLSDEDRRMLQDEVSVIFHSAATVNFDIPLGDAIRVNTRGTLEIVKLGLEMKNLKVLVHVSTMYANCDKIEVLEKVYSNGSEWKTMIKMAERPRDDHLLRCLTEKIDGNHPNTYTYTKALAEDVINDFRDELPVVILRPSVVSGSLNDPMPGWIDNFNGPFGLFTAGGKGVLRSVYGDYDNYMNLVPVDIAIKAMIYVAWYTAVTQGPGPQPTPVYNAASFVKPMTLQFMITTGVSHVKISPYSTVLWYLNPTITPGRLAHYFKVLFFHMLPAIIVDGLLHFTGRKTFLFRLQRKIYIANTTLGYFIKNNSYIFPNTQLLSAHDAMKIEDRKDFAFDEIVEDVLDYMKISYFGTRIYLLKETVSAQDRVMFNRMYWADRVLKISLLLLAIWLFGICSKIRAVSSYIQAVSTKQFII